MSTKQFEAYFRWRDVTGEIKDRFEIFEAKSQAEAKRLAKSYAEQHQVAFCSVDTVRDESPPIDIQSAITRNQ